jgi:signal transduction histidine kinase
MQVAARTRKNVIDLELDLVRADGTVLNTLSYSAPVFDQQGELRRVINVCVDVTERKRSEQERKRLQEVLVKAEKYRSLALMAGGLAHDFNNLLTAMIGHAELACRDIPPASPAGHEVAAALAAANRAAELIAQLLAYTGRGWFEQKRLDLSMEIRHVAEGIRAMAPAGVHIEFELAEGLPPVYGGEREVQQVLRNLVLNAIEAIGEGSGDISVRTRLCEFAEEELARDFPGQELIPGTYVALEVTDSGHGASSEVVARVFEPFFTTKFIGRGLGLSAVEGIMRAHGGGVHFDALSERGVRVQVIFPAPHDAGPGSESRVYPLTPLVNPEPAHRIST